MIAAILIIPNFVMGETGEALNENRFYSTAWSLLPPIIAIILAFIVPKLFVGMAFDAGTVASGPMSATIILAFSQGIAFRDPLNVANPVADAFGTIALIALTPIIAIEILGILFKIKSRKVGVPNEQ